MFRRITNPAGTPFGRTLAAALLLLAAACGSDKPAQGTAAVTTAPPVQTTALAVPPAPPSNQRMQCVPYARAFTGIFIRGDAWTWWLSVGSYYSRGNVPEPFSLLVLAKTERLKAGHLSVVVGVDGPREIRVSHANWLNDERILENMPVIDVSEKNDWSQVRFWNPQTNEFGRVYDAYGFVYRNPDTPGA
jgi:hypothetical protein